MQLKVKFKNETILLFFYLDIYLLNFVNNNSEKKKGI